MASVLPFRAFRPKSGLEPQIASLPYDVFNRAEAKEYVADKPLSFLNIDRPETAFDLDANMYSDEVYMHAKAELECMIAGGEFMQDSTACYYIYQQTFMGHTQTGIVGLSSIWDYKNDIVKKHELTRTEKEQDRINHIKATKMQTGPIFLAHKPNAEVAEIKQKYVENFEPYCRFKSDNNVENTCWIVQDEQDINALKQAFDQLDCTYIADGHHRCASAVKVGLEIAKANPRHTGKEEYNNFLSVLFDSADLKILDYNRIVSDLNGLTVDEFLKEVSSKFEITRVGEALEEEEQVETTAEDYAIPTSEKRMTPASEKCMTPATKGKLPPIDRQVSAAESKTPLTAHQVSPFQPKTFGMYLNGSWYKLTFRGNVPNDPVKSLDVSILQDFLLYPILGIDDPQTNSRINFVGGIRGLSELEKQVDAGAAVAFSMYPTSMEQLFEVADAGLLMPPKSTWFEPKLLSGLFLHKI